MNFTPHMYAAVGLAVIALACTWSGIFMSARAYEITSTEYTVSSQQSSLGILPAQKIIQSIGGEPQRMQQNPFAEAREVFDDQQSVDVGFPLPPAPPLALPAPPILPLPGDQ